MTLGLSIGGEEICVVASPAVLAAIRRRFGPFVGSSSTRAPILLEVRESPRGFSPAFEQPEQAQVRQVGPEEIAIEGSVRGRYQVAARRGFVEDASGLGALDCLLRVALSSALPLGGSLLLHGAALAGPGGGALALCGASGCGKSTAAAALGALCDELVVLRPVRGAPSGVELRSTPYWQGQPLRARCDAVVCLLRGVRPELRWERGAAAARALAPHVVRYLALDRVERAILQLLGRVCESVQVATAACPEGDAFVPFLASCLRQERLQPQWRAL